MNSEKKPAYIGNVPKRAGKRKGKRKGEKKYEV